MNTSEQKNLEYEEIRIAQKIVMQIFTLIDVNGDYSENINKMIEGPMNNN